MVNRQSLIVVDWSGQDAQQLGNVRTDADITVWTVEELIDEFTNDNEKGTDNPGTECAGGHIWVIVGVDNSTDLGVGRVLYVSCQRPTCAVITGLRLTTMIRAASILSSS
jgi:hypothetical protein